MSLTETQVQEPPKADDEFPGMPPAGVNDQQQPPAAAQQPPQASAPPAGRTRRPRTPRAKQQPAAAQQPAPPPVPDKRKRGTGFAANRHNMELSATGNLRDMPKILAQYQRDMSRDTLGYLVSKFITPLCEDAVRVLAYRSTPDEKHWRLLEAVGACVEQLRQGFVIIARGSTEDTEDTHAIELYKLFTQIAMDRIGRSLQQ